MRLCVGAMECVCFWIPRTQDDIFGFLAKLHDYLEHRSQHVLPGTDRNAWRSTSDLNVRIHPYINSRPTPSRQRFPVRNKLASPTATLAKSIWAAKLPIGITMIMCDVHVESNGSAILAWHGHTYEVRAAFNATPFRLLPEEYRMLCQLENVDLVNSILSAHNVKDAFVNLRVAEEVEAAVGSAVARFLSALTHPPNIFVDAF